MRGDLSGRKRKRQVQGDGNASEVVENGTSDDVDDADEFDWSEEIPIPD